MKLHPKLTARQQQVLDYLRAFFEENDQLPPMQTLADHFGWKSANSAVTFAAILEAKGYIEKNAVGKYRFSRHQPDFSDTVPLTHATARDLEQGGFPVLRLNGRLQGFSA